MNFKKFQFAGTPNSSVLAEKGEVYKSPNGQIQQIAQHAPSHDDGEQVNQFGIKPTAKGNGGVVVDADSVLSDSYSQVSSGKRENSMKEQIVKIKAEEGEIIASQLGLDIRLKKAVSPSKLFLEIQEAKDKIALKIMKASEKTQKTRESSNALQANQAQLMSLPTDEEIYEAIFNTQEEKKENSFLDFEEEAEAQYGISFDKKRALRNLQAENTRTYTDDRNPLSDFGILSPSPSKIEIGKHEQSFTPVVENPNNWITKPKIEQIETGLDDSAQFLDNWYGRRNKITSPIKFGDEVFDTDIQDVFGGEVANAAAYYDSEFKKSNFRTDVPFKSNTGVHEYTHAIDDRYGQNMGNSSPALKTNYKELGIQPTTPVFTGNKNLIYDYNVSKENGFSNEYYTAPEESYARLNELRRTANFSPNYNVKKEDIQKLREENKTNKLFLFYDDESIMKMWNGLSSTNFNSPTIEKPMLQQTAKFGIKNKIPTSELGVHKYHNQPVIVPTRGTGQYGNSTYVQKEEKIPFLKPSSPVMRKNLMNSLGVRNVSTSYYPGMEKDVQDMISMKNEDSSLDFDDESTSQYGGAKMYPSSTQVSRTIVPFFAISLLGEKEAKPFDSLTPENYLKLAVDNGKIVGHDLQDIQFETTKPLHKFNRDLDEKYRNDKEFWKISDLKYNQRHNQKIPKSMLDDILDGAIKSGVDPYDALAIAQRESGFGNNYSFDKAPKSIFSNWYEDVQLSKGLNELSYKTIEQAKKYSDKNTQYPFASEMNTIKEKTKKYGLRGYNYGDPDYPNKIAKEKEIMFSDENKEFRDYVNSRIKRKQYGGAHYNKNLNYILPNSLLDEKNEDIEEPVFKLKKKEIKGDKRNGYSAYEQNGEIYMDNINDEPIKQHETFHYLRSKGYFSPREQAIENELLDGSIYSPLDKNKLNSEIYSPEELAARFHSISGYLPNNYKEEDFKKLWETGKDLQIQDLKQVIPYDKALYYMNNYHPSKMQMGGMVSKDSSNLKEIKKQRDWLRAWYGERDIVTEPIEIFENELKSVNGSKTKDPEILKQNEEFRERGKKTNFDVSAYYHTPSDRSVFLKDVTGTTDPIHEFTHSIDNNYGDNIGTFNSINPFHPLKTDYTKLGVKPIKENDYFTNTEETYARLNEARYSSGYAANYKPTLEDIKEQRRLNKKNKPKAYNHLFDYYDDNSIMQMWNGLSDTRFEESSVENPMLQQTAKYGIKKQYGGSSSILKQLQLL